MRRERNWELVEGGKIIIKIYYARKNNLILIRGKQKKQKLTNKQY